MIAIIIIISGTSTTTMKDVQTLAKGTVGEPFPLKEHHVLGSSTSAWNLAAPIHCRYS